LDAGKSFRETLVVGVLTYKNVRIIGKTPHKNRNNRDIDIFTIDMSIVDDVFHPFKRHNFKGLSNG